MSNDEKINETSTDETSNIPSSTQYLIENDVVEQSIEIMQKNAGLCVHPLHYHSFQAQNGMQTILSNSSLSLRRFYDKDKSAGATNSNICILCCEELSTLSSRMVPQMFQRSTMDSSASKKSNEPILKCLACHTFAHRSCATSTTPVIHYVKVSAEKASRTKKPPLQQPNVYEVYQQCTVNRLKILEPTATIKDDISEGSIIQTDVADINRNIDPSSPRNGSYRIENATREPRRMSDYPGHEVAESAQAVSSEAVTTDYEVGTASNI